jgi:ankyrin repeat protein
MTLFQARLKLAQKRLAAKEFTAAITQLLACLNNTVIIETLPAHTVIDMKLDLASAYQGSGNASEAQPILLELLNGDIPKVQEHHLEHTLAVAYLHDGDPELARQYAEKALKGRTKLLGRHHTSTHETVSLLVDICMSQENEDDADVYRELLPAGFIHGSISSPVIVLQDPTVLKWLSGKNIDINNEQSYFKALHEAKDEKKPAIARILLEKRSKVTGSDEEGMTMLMHAAVHGFANIVRDLLARGADIEAKHDNGSTVLLLASYRGYESITQSLLDRGADVNHKNNEGTTALVLATHNGHESIVQLLLDRGADVNHKNNEGTTALILATQNGHESIVQLLLEKGADVNHETNKGSTALLFATQNCHESIVHLLLDGGADANCRTDSWVTPLIYASEIGKEGTVRALLERGASVRMKDKTNRTALDYARRKKHSNVVALLQHHEMVLRKKEEASKAVQASERSQRRYFGRK